ncbi:hypothetical protein CAI21_09515 [Alkalilimnicola ehrlichii]|uniref:PET hydrolase/cutinase-like domain-containing protein n=1 Tax=Alkalilimnicola ehrlichii TaxID=351052 RepID=A0A3E0WVG8_9GAMM|nr:dienelactone hydrolase family protein [Alkalilimnicola ehrlichii]RFA29306.1 hypothetical protein CAI21_09515 [Alkalilimnicola ehrlichii]RFA36818.1 hypothetical protein CAL65_09845 [Alkalilimnicola ehrlichii]
MIKQHKGNLLLSLLAAGSLLISAAAFAMNPDDGYSGLAAACDNSEGCGFARGPDPSVDFLEADRGPYRVSTSRVSSLVGGFGGGTIHYPTSAEGTMAAIVVIPGYISSEGSIEWWGPKLASHGFVVLTIDTRTGFDQPPSRARQINNALDYLLEQNDRSRSDIYGMIDPDRLGVIGWSMGGGGTLRVGTEGRIRAAIPLAPWDTTRRHARDAQAPTLIFACQLDAVAPVGLHASPFYDNLPDSIPKAYVEINNGTHWCANGDNRHNDVLSRYGISWMKLHLDEDERYKPFLCDVDHTADRQISDYRGNCPY